jgi:hypothetical protein
MVYMLGIVVLMVPIVWLGLPEGSSAEELKGQLANLRVENDLGRASLGGVDPASSTMTLVLFGFRGIAASVLWYQADELKSQKNWSELERTAESIVLLQPHYWNVWDTQAWNLAYNVSAEFDDVRDRFFWVKQGAKFLQTGIDRNRKVPEMWHYLGEFIGRKIGYSDERNLFRKFFVNDPDERFDRDGSPDTHARPEEYWTDNGADPEINPNGEDNYVVARRHFARANEVLMNDAGGEQHKMADILFRAGPYKAQMDYARARSREGLLDEVTRQAWEKAYKDYTEEYGKLEFSTPGGWIKLNATEEELEALTRKDGKTLEDKKTWQARERDLTNYRFWSTHCEVERIPEMVEARRTLYEAREVWEEVGDAVRANELYLKGMGELENVLLTFRDGYLCEQDEGLDYIEDAMDAVLRWQTVNAGRPMPPDYPLKRFFESTDEKYVNVRNEVGHRIATELYRGDNKF